MGLSSLAAAWEGWERGEDLGEMGRVRKQEQPWPCQVPLTQHPSCPQCATHQLCHPEELVLLGHALGIPQPPLSSCSSQALQLVSFWRGGGRQGEGRMVWKSPWTPRLQCGALRGVSQAARPDSSTPSPRWAACVNSTAASSSTRASCRPWQGYPPS